MKKFKFRLQRVQDYRATVRDEKKRVLLIRNQKLRDEQDRLEILLQTQRENIDPQGLVPIEELYVRGLFASRLREEIAMQRLNIIKVEEEVKEALAEYIEAAKDLKALETLKAHRLAEYWEDYYKEEGKFLDELAVQRGNRLYPTRESEDEVSYDVEKE